MVSKVRRDTQHEYVRRLHYDSNLPSVARHLRFDQPFYLQGDDISPYGFNPKDLISDDLALRQAEYSLRVAIDGDYGFRRGTNLSKRDIQVIVGREDEGWLVAPIARDLRKSFALVEADGSISGDIGERGVVVIEGFYNRGNLVDLLVREGVKVRGALAHVDAGDSNSHYTTVSLNAPTWELLREQGLIPESGYERVREHAADPGAWRARALESPENNSLVERYLRNPSTRDVMERLRAWAHAE